jgi:aryl-alcohol dehydrogenase-like predicted oxidoreductase
MAEDSAIPGTAKLHRLEENVGVIDVELTNDDLRKVRSTASKLTVHGASELVEKMIGL